MAPSGDLTLMAVGDVLIQRPDFMSIVGDTIVGDTIDVLAVGGPTFGTPPTRRAPEVLADELRYITEHTGPAGAARTAAGPGGARRT